MTELLEKRLLEIQDAIENGIVVQADADFLFEFIRAQGRKVQELNERIEELEKDICAVTVG